MYWVYYTNRINNEHFVGILLWKGLKVRLQGKVNIPKRERVTGSAREPYQHLCKNNWKCFSAAALVACVAAAKQRWLHAAPVSHSPPIRARLPLGKVPRILYLRLWLAWCTFHGFKDPLDPRRKCVFTTWVAIAANRRKLLPKRQLVRNQPCSRLRTRFT